MYFVDFSGSLSQSNAIAYFDCGSRDGSSIDEKQVIFGYFEGAAQLLSMDLKVLDLCVLLVVAEAVNGHHVAVCVLDLIANLEGFHGNETFAFDLHEIVLGEACARRNVESMGNGRGSR